MTKGKLTDAQVGGFILDCMKNPRKCPECGSQNTMHRKRDNTYWCRRCPAEWKVESK